MSEISNTSKNVIGASSFGRRIRRRRLGSFGSHQKAERMKQSAPRWSQFRTGGRVFAVGLNPVQHPANPPIPDEIIGGIL